MALKNGSTLKKVSLTSLVITLGIVFGDLGTSPLYVFNAILTSVNDSSESLLYGVLSCVFWTITLQTTIKYVIITPSANNKGEGGIFALFALTKKKTPIAAIITMVGGATLLADGVITPAITVTSAVEGLHFLNLNIPVIPIVLGIFVILFFVQQFGTNFLGGTFGPIMAIWFSMLGIMGVSYLISYPDVLRAINPAYAVKFLSAYPKGFILLGAIFLCTTGAEALYTDMGHVGIKNIRISWAFVKTALLLNYFGQAAWIMQHQPIEIGRNPFYAMMPGWFLIPGILISTCAAIIASQALITGSNTLISEAVSLNFWPKIRVLHPTHIKGQVYIPLVNWYLFLACCFSVLFFKKSTNLEAAYGLSITIAMIMDTLLLSNFMFTRKMNYLLGSMILTVFIVIEGSFLVANLYKFKNGGWYSLLLGTVFFLIMYGWYFGRKIKNKYISFVNLNNYLDLFIDLKKDSSVPKIATNLVYIIKANKQDQVESKIIYSIFNKQPKRADTYWFLHINIINQPDTFKYTVNHIIPGTLIKIDFNLGFKIEPRINLYFKEILEDMEKTGEVTLLSSFDSLKKRGMHGDFLFVNLDRIMTRDHKLSPWETFTMNLHELTRVISINDIRALGLDSTSIIEEKVPITIERPVDRRIERG
jgi:KUP system potassium uptake protein